MKTDLKIGRANITGLVDTGVRSKAEDYFTDSLDQINAIETEVKIRTALAYLRSPHAADAKRQGNGPDLGFLGLGTERPSVESLEVLLKSVEAGNALKARRSLARGVDLNFESFCSTYDLTFTERRIAGILLAVNTGLGFKEFYESCFSDREFRGSLISIGALLSLLSGDYRERIRNRGCFSTEGTLVGQDIVVFWNDSIDKTENILDMGVCMHERFVRFILGDNNTYNSSLGYLKREKGGVSLDQVVIEPGLKADIVSMAENYFAQKEKRESLGVDGFYGYGTGLAFLLHGPSGSGKTMLARALASHLGKALLTINLSEAGRHERHVSLADLIPYVFKEAALTDSIVFFDECDDLFRNNSSESRALLVELEKARCLTMFATNKTVELDPSLARRIMMKVGFEVPGTASRKKIWSALVPKGVSLAGDVDLQQLAERYVFTGGLIKNVLLMAINSVMGDDASEGVVLGAGDIEKAAEYQAANMLEDNGFASLCTPVARIDELALRPNERRELTGLADAYSRLASENCGLSLVVDCTDLETGIEAAEAIAGRACLKIKRFWLKDVFGDTGTKITDPVSQREMTKKEFAFVQSTGHRAATVFIDDRGLFGRYLSGDENSNSFIEELLSRLRGFSGLFVLVTNSAGGLKGHKLPLEFNYCAQLRYPPEDTQIKRWEGRMDGTLPEGELLSLVEMYPMHIREIDFIVRQARIRSHLREQGGVSITLLKEVVAEYRQAPGTPLLFGR